MTRRTSKTTAIPVKKAKARLLERIRRAGPEKGLAGLAGGWEGSDELVNLILGHPRSKARTAPRPR